MELHARIREERERLGYSQTAFATLAGVSKQAQINWEKGAAAPNAANLAAWSTHGADVLYIVTGQRERPPAPEPDPSEYALLSAYRQCPMASKAALLQTAVLLAAGKSVGSVDSTAATAGLSVVNSGANAIQIGLTTGKVRIVKPR